MTKTKTHKIDATGISLGRLATQAATILQGKNQADFQPHIDNSDRVLIYNCDSIQITGDKLNQKKYYNYSGYPGGLRERSLKTLMEEDSREVIRKAVYGMLPSNRMRNDRQKRLTLHTKNITEDSK